VEAWPFTNLLGSFLAARRYVIGSLDVAGWRAHAATARGLGRSAEWRAGIEAWDLATAGSVISWEPVLFGIGVTGRDEARLAAHRVQLAAVSLGTGFRAGAFELNLDARQFVMARVFRNPAPATVESGDDSAVAPAGASTGSSRARGWPGGTALMVSIRRGGR
jgi:hypothetical protein